MNKKIEMTHLSASRIRKELDSKGYLVADVGNRDDYLAICNDLGKVTQTREVFIKPKEAVEKYTGYSHLPDEVPFHTDYPLINVVGLLCEQPDGTGGENLLIDCREILKELSSIEIEALKSIRIPLPRSGQSIALLTVDEQQVPHIYWLPAVTLSNLDRFEEWQVSAVRRFDQVLTARRDQGRYISLKLKAGQAVWFNNFVMLHGRDRLDESSKRFQVRAFIEYANENTNKKGGD